MVSMVSPRGISGERNALRANSLPGYIGKLY
jgi:hypothetical protein